MSPNLSPKSHPCRICFEYPSTTSILEQISSFHVVKFQIFFREILWVWVYKMATYIVIATNGNLFQKIVQLN